MIMMISYILLVDIFYVEKDPTDSTCFVEDSFVVTVYPSPLVDVKPVQVVTCNTTFVLDNLSNISASLPG